MLRMVLFSLPVFSSSVFELAAMNFVLLIESLDDFEGRLALTIPRLAEITKFLI